jgi:hypothetical protein
MAYRRAVASPHRHLTWRSAGKRKPCLAGALAGQPGPRRGASKQGRGASSDPVKQPGPPHAPRGAREAEQLPEPRDAALLARAHPHEPVGVLQRALEELRLTPGEADLARARGEGAGAGAGVGLPF